ncbi:MAG: tyrosine-protein kinase Etk/Wzc, partial [Arenicella sp.]
MENLNQNNNQKTSRFNKDLDLNLMLTVLNRNKFVPLILLVLSLTAAFIYLRYTKPIYESSAIIQRSSQDEGKRILDIDGFEQENSLSEDIELLRSTFLLEKSLKNLNLEISYYSEGEILTEEKYLLSSYHVTILELKDSSLIGSKIAVKSLGENNVQLSFIKKSGEEENFDIKANTPVNNEHFNLIFKINNKDAFYAVSNENNLYFTFNNYSNLTRVLHPHLAVYALNPEAKTIKVSFKSNNRVLSKDVVSSVITTFFQYDLEKKRQSSANVLDFIDSQLDTVFVQLKESETAIQSFKDRIAVSDPEYVTAQIMERSNDLQNQLLDVDFELELINEVEKSVQLEDRIEIYKIIPAVTGTDYEELLIAELEELHELLVKKEDLTYSVTENNDRLKKATRNIDSQIGNIFRIISTVKDQLKFKQQSIQNRIYKVESQLYGIPEKEMELSRLNRMFNLNEKYYTLLIEKKTQYAISKAGFTMDNMVLQAPSDAALISPDKSLIYTIAIILTFFISLVFLLIKYITFNDIQEADELKGLVPSSIGFLGVIPKIQTQEYNSTLVVHMSPKSALAESFRHIRSNLQFILKPEQSNVIAISSSISGEGKTFVAVNIGGIIAMSGKKVLVIDLDLRKPKVHLALHVDNNIGMSSILANNEDWKKCIHQSELENFDFITSGPIPPNPSELIIGDTLDKTIEEFKKEYDVIIIDNPPVGIVSDGISVLNKADCPIYIFRANYSKRYFAQRVRELVETEKVDKLFIALNAVKINHNGYGYGYGYGGY